MSNRGEFTPTRGEKGIVKPRSTHNDENWGAERSLGRRRREHNVHGAEIILAHRTGRRIEPGNAVDAAVRTTAVALFGRRTLGLHLALPARDLHRGRLLRLLLGGLFRNPEFRVGDDLPELRYCRVVAEVGHHCLRLLRILLNRMNLEP